MNGIAVVGAIVHHKGMHALVDLILELLGLHLIGSHARAVAVVAASRGEEVTTGDLYFVLGLSRVDGTDHTEDTSRCATTD